MSDLDAMVEAALRAADGYEQAEAYASETVIHTVYVDGTCISNVETKRESGLMVRMADGGRQGKSSVTIGGNAVAECVRMAEEVIRRSPAGPQVRYAEPGAARIADPGVRDRRVEEVTPDDLRELAQRLIDSCDVDIPRAQIRVSSCTGRVMNSNGVDAAHRSTLVYGHFTSMFRGEHPGEGEETFHGTHLDVPIEGIGASLSRQARDSAVAKGYEGHGEMSMILPPGQLGDMIMSSVGDAINGENVRYGRSLWKDSLGQEVASGCVTMVDDPTVPAPLSCVFDDEGTPTERRTVIEDGVLRSFLRDSSCGESTGNGMRRSSVEAMGAFERTPAVKPLNLVVSPGRGSREDIVAGTDRGILVERFANPEADGLSGRFGLNVRCGYLVRNGEVVGVVNNSLLMGNMFEALKAVEMVGADVRQMGVVSVPTMSFSGAELVGNRSPRAPSGRSGRGPRRTLGGPHRSPFGGPGHGPPPWLSIVVRSAARSTMRSTRGSRSTTSQTTGGASSATPRNRHSGSSRAGAGRRPSSRRHPPSPRPTWLRRSRSSARRGAPRP